MPFQVTAAVLNEVGGEFSLQTVTLDDLRSDEVLVRIEASGICHTDINSQAQMQMPVVLGHEGAGVVEAVGSAVDDLEIGTRVVMSFGSCNTCSQCFSGKPYSCERSVETNFGGARPDGSTTTSNEGAAITASFFQQSSFASHSITAARNVVPVKSDVSSTILAPLGCGIMTGAGTVLNTFSLGAKDSLVVFGTGAVGLSAVMAAKLSGAKAIVAVDINESRLDLALELGATHVVNAKSDDVHEQILAACGGGAQYSFETSGVDSALEEAINCLAMEGVCGMVTVPHYGEKFPFTPFGVFVKAATLQGIFFGSSVPRVFLPKLIEYYLAGQFPYDKLIQTYEFANINQAIADTASGKVIKPVLTMV